jgi:tetratricopeptide (TPR) repeat protein
LKPFDFFLANTSIKAILFGVAFLFFALQISVNKKNTFFRILQLAILIVLGLFIIILDSRIVWVAIILVLFIVNGKKTHFSKKASWFVGFLVIVFFTVCLLYKYSSTLGRLFIYKIDFLVIKNNWLKGIGQPFNIVFNHTQATYFSNQNKIVSKETLLASNGFFVFNEWLSAFIHFGIAGFIISVLATFILLKECFKQLVTNPAKKTAIGIIMFLLIVALVSYPFSFGIYTCIFICLALYVLKDANWFPKKINKPVCLILLYCSIIIFYSAKEINAYKQEKQREEVNELFRAGYINSALEKAIQLSYKFNDDGYLYKIISELYLQKNKIDSAIHFIKKAHEYVCTDEIHAYWGDCLKESGKLKEAKNQYQLAINIVPHRFGNRIKLLDNYLLLNEVVDAKKCALGILILPEKIPSDKTKSYKIKAKRIADSLNNNSK